MAARHPIFSALYDLMLAPAEYFGMARTRSRVVGELSGRVLEIGVGTGLNLPRYGGATAVFGIEPDIHMLKRARPRSLASPARVSLLAADGQRLPFKAQSFDSAVATLVFCTIPDAEAALREVKRVLKPGGIMRFVEHVRAPSARVAALQDGLDYVWPHLFGGCHPNRATAEVIERAGFVLRGVNRRGVMVSGDAVTP